MTSGIVHPFTNPKSDGGDTTITRPSDWNADHSAPYLSASGLTGATQASRYVGATTTGSPGSGTFSTGDYVVAQDGKFWICTAGGSPGTWISPSSGGGLYAYDETFPGSSLPAGWAFTGSGTCVVSGGVATVTGAAQSDRLLFNYTPPTNGMFVIRAHLQNVTGEGGMPSLCILDSTGNGAATGPYNDATWYGWAVDGTPYIYQGTDATVGASPSLTDVWASLLCIDGYAVGCGFSTDGSDWSGQAFGIHGPFTFNRVGIIQLFTAANIVVDLVELTITEP